MKQRRLRAGRPKKTSPPDYVTSWDELARRLGRSRKTLVRWRKRYQNDPELPLQRGDRHSVSAWQRWIKLRALTNVEEQDDEPEKHGVAHWNTLNARLAYDRNRFEFEAQRKKHLPLEDITHQLGKMDLAIRALVNTIPERVAKQLADQGGSKDFHAIQTLLQNESEKILATICRCEFLKQFTEPIVEARFGDFDPKTKAKVAAAIDQQFREVGRRILQDLLQRELPPVH